MTLDMQALTANVLTDLIRSSFSSITKGAKNLAGDAWAKIFEDFHPFMVDSYNRNLNVRILCQKEQDVNLYDVYVQSRFKCGHEIYDDEQIIHKIGDGKNIIVNGNGGAGKTFFMRHLWLTLFRNQSSMTPIFVELRQLNDLTKIDMKAFIRLTISRKRELTEENFQFFLREWPVLLLA